MFLISFNINHLELEDIPAFLSYEAMNEALS
jgi:hypothetical protein